MELMLMLCLLGITVLLGFGLVLLLISGVMGRIVARFARGRADQHQWQNRTKLATLAVLLGGISYSGYTAVYPPDSVYLDELAQVSLRPPAASARVVDKNAAYPDFHGDYCSYSRIELSPADFQTLLSQVESDQRLRPVAVKLSQKDALRSASKAFSRYQAGKQDRHLSMAFLADGKSADVNVCVT